MRTQSRQQLKRQILLAQRAHEMRHQLTRSESALWIAISRGQLGVAFRRQVPIGNRYIADFLAPRVKLVVEVDGGYHRERAAADARHTRVLERLGYRVLRLLCCPRRVRRVCGRGCSLRDAPLRARETPKRVLTSCAGLIRRSGLVSRIVKCTSIAARNLLRARGDTTTALR